MEDEIAAGVRLFRDWERDYSWSDVMASDYAVRDLVASLLRLMAPSAALGASAEEMNEELFKVIEPSSGKTYRIFANGRVDGFEPEAVVFNYAAMREAYFRSLSIASACPPMNTVPAFGGAAHASAPYKGNTAVMIDTAAGLK